MGVEEDLEEGCPASPEAPERTATCREERAREAARLRAGLDETPGNEGRRASSPTAVLADFPDGGYILIFSGV